MAKEFLETALFVKADVSAIVLELGKVTVSLIVDKC